MHKTLLRSAIATTIVAFGSSIYLATLENPTDIQRNLSTTSNAIAIAGTTAIFGLLDDKDEDENDSSAG